MVRSRDFYRKVRWARANLRSVAVPLGGCRERLCEFFVGSLCYRGGCKGSVMDLALIYVRSLCRWAVAANACVSFLLGRCAIGAVAKGRKRSLR